MYVDPERMDQHRATYGELVRDVVTAAPSTRELLNQINEHVEAGKYYPALKAARQLIDYEQELIRNVSQRP
jgi:flagellar protein FlbT